MSVSANGKMLAMATKHLSAQWSETRQQWQDAKADEFERRQLAELISSVERAVPVFDDLEKLLAKVRNDCE